MKNFDLNEILSSSMKNMANMAANYKTEAPPWFMPTQLLINMSPSSLFDYLSSQLFQYAIFQGKTLNKFSIYFPEDKYILNNLNDVSNHIISEHKSLKQIFNNEYSVLFVSSDEILLFDLNSSKIEVSSISGFKLKSLKDTMIKIGRK